MKQTITEDDYTKLYIKYEKLLQDHEVLRSDFKMTYQTIKKLLDDLGFLNIKEGESITKIVVKKMTGLLDQLTNPFRKKSGTLEEKFKYLTQLGPLISKYKPEFDSDGE